ncbi:MAG: hypothetical protein SF069_11700 [Phycisphaerae bacterium]|nr:hypothetical protein [Phycisphaerae bacterium]
MKRVRLIYPQTPRPGVGAQLEARAWRAVRAHLHQNSDSPAHGALAAELALTLEQLGQVRNVHAALHSELNRLVAALEEERNRELAKRFHYETPNLLLVERMRVRHAALQAEARRLRIAEMEGVRSFEDRLLILLNRQRFVGELYDDDRGDRPAA